MPPRGLQLMLGTNATPRMVDTIVMSNFGYFQLKVKKQKITEKKQVRPTKKPNDPTPKSIQLNKTIQKFI